MVMGIVMKLYQKISELTSSSLKMIVISMSLSLSQYNRPEETTREMTKTLQRYTYGNSHRRSQFWLLFIWLLSSKIHTQAQIHILKHCHTHKNWIYLSRCVGVGVSVGDGDGKPLSTILFSKHFLFCILSFLHSQFCPLRSFVVFIGFTRIIVTINEKFFTVAVSAKQTYLMITKLPATTQTLVSDLSSGIYIFSLHFSIQIQKLSSFLSLFFHHKHFICTESDVIILRVVIVKTISFNAFETNRFWWSFYFI